MKNLTSIIIILTASLFSCSSYLDLQPKHLISEQSFFQSRNDFETALVGAYSSLRGMYSGSTIQYIADLGSDNSEIVWSSPTVDEMQLSQNAVTSTNTILSTAWNTCLYTISRCNTILNKIDGIDFDQKAKNTIKGETLFLRGLSYFYLVQLFGNVPVTDLAFTSPAQIASSDLSLKPSAQVYAKVIADLTAAEGLLPAALNPDKTRASLSTVKTLLGKVYLTQKDYSKAETKLKEVIDANQYSLFSNYGNLFVEGNNNRSESILEVQFVSGKNLGNNYSALFTPAITSMAIFPGNLQGSGRILPTVSLVNAYEDGDIRKAVSVKEGIPLINGTTAPGRYALKFVDFTITSASDGNVTFTVLRYADILLMYAEALNENNRTDLAHDYLNNVRNRAKLSPLSGLSQADFRLAIERERRVEFAYEGHRWFDLKRTGRLSIVLDAFYAGQSLNFRVLEHEWIQPIPQNEVDLNPAVIKQNPGY